VLYHVRDEKLRPHRGSEEETPETIRDLVASFQEAVVDTLIDRTLRAVDERGARTVAVVGGVACNRRLRQRMLAEGTGRGVPVVFPRPALCADNAAMIASVGRVRLARGERDPLTLNADPGWQI
jgi:N6-L-threonylcarbamoyladenine synthase